MATNVIFTVIIGILSVIEFVFIVTKKEKSIRGSILAIGIFGTFLGIFIGLQDFNANPSEIDNSVVNLIAGLKTAFFTSMLGMGASILLTLFAKFFEKENKIDKKEEDEIKRQFSFLEDIHKSLEQNRKETTDILTKIENSFSTFLSTSQQAQDLSVIQNIVDELQEINGKIVNTKSVYDLVEDTKNSIEQMTKGISDSLNSHSQKFETKIDQVGNSFDNGIQKIFSELNTKVSNIGTNFDNSIQNLLVEVKQLFAKFDTSLSISLDNLSEKSANEIAQALGYTVDRFNQTLLDGFGQNFRELNSAVKDLVNWQNNYKTSIETTEKGLEKSLIAIEDFEKIMSKHDEVLKIYQQLQTIIQTFDTQIQSISQHLQSYKNLGDEAKKMTPEVVNFLDMVQQNIIQVDKRMADITGRFGSEYDIYISSIKKLLQTASSPNQGQ